MFPMFRQCPSSPTIKMALFVSCLLIFSATHGIFGEAATIEDSPGDLQDSTHSRLTKLEAKLESVLEKNAELEQRIEVLEKENEQLHELLTDADTKQTSTNAESQDGQVRGIRDTLGRHIHQRQANAEVARRSKVPRNLLSGDPTVGFTATLSYVKATKLGQGQTIKYNRILTNFGQAYNSITGVFTAPIGSVYVFNYDSMVEPGDSEYLELMKDGTRVLDTLVSASGESRYVTTSRTVVLQINQGTTVWIQAKSGSGTVYGNQHSSFSGWMLAALE